MAFSTAGQNPASFRGTSAGLRLVLVALLCLTLMVLDHQNQHLVSLRKNLSLMVQPLIFLVSTPSRIGSGVSDSFTTRNTLKQENRDLNRRMLVMSAQLQQLAILKTENARLRALLDSTAKLDDRVLVAEIVAVDMNPFRQSILINKGSRDGVKVGAALIDAEGIIGQITRDQGIAAEALLITDLDHALPVEVLRNRLRTIANGTGSGDKLSLPFLPRNADIREGDMLVTSGLGGTFPAGYPVGTIAAIRSAPGQPFLEIEAAPAAQLNRVREVLVVLQEEQREPAAEATATVIDESMESSVPADETAPIDEPTPETGSTDSTSSEGGTD